MTLPCLGGGPPVRLAHLGRPAVVNLWATWCRACAEELPVLAGVARTTHGRVVFLGIDTGDDPDSALDTLSVAGVHYPSLYDRRSQSVKRLGLPGLPATVLVRADGTVAYTKLGALSGADELRKLLGTYLGIAS
ncbi:MAG: TlpA disulfide reductase family protein [Pseudonocardiales bacterium]